jgi:predicted enzyme related to lactoylglutathione lyase
MIRDPDGFMIEAMQYSPYRAHSRLVVGVNDIFNAMRFYTEIFGFVIDPPFWDPTVKAVDLFWDPDPRVMDLLDISNAPSRYIFMRFRSSPDWFELMEFKNITRKPFRPALSDPGAATVSLIVPDVGAVAKAVKSGGGTVVSAGGQIVAGPQGPAVMVRDVDGFYLEVIQEAR